MQLYQAAVAAIEKAKSSGRAPVEPGRSSAARDGLLSQRRAEHDENATPPRLEWGAAKRLKLFFGIERIAGDGSEYAEAAVIEHERG